MSGRLCRVKLRLGGSDQVSNDFRGGQPAGEAFAARFPAACVARAPDADGAAERMSQQTRPERLGRVWGS